MGELIELAQYRADRARPVQDGPVTVFFDLGSPFSYLAVERVERVLGDVEWVPTAPLGPLTDAERAEAERQARALRLPLVWPEGTLNFPLALRAAAYAAEIGRGAQFALAATRLAFCGGFDLDDPEILGEAASAAGITPHECLAAAAELDFDEQLQATAEGLRRRGADQLPAILIGGEVRCGMRAVAEAAALAGRAGENSRALSRG
jgi:2-hydroxychromene-2-carboxylate isomerase